MDILGIGIPELGFIILIALILLGPKDMQKAGKTIGGFMRKIVMSPEWRTVKDVSRKVKTLPNEWMREANEEIQGLGDNLNIDNEIKGVFGENSAPNSGRPQFVVPKKNIAKKEETISENTEEKSPIEGENG